MTSEVPARRGRPRRMSVDDARRQVLDAAIELFGTDGPGATIEAIALRAGVAKPSVYELYPSKEALLEAAADDVFDRFVAHLLAAHERVFRSPLPDRVHGRVAAIVEYIAAHPAEMRLISFERARSDAFAGRAASVRASMTRQLSDLVRQDLGRVGVTAERAPELVAAMLVGLTLEAAERAFEEGWEPEPVVEVVSRFVTAGLLGLDREVLSGLDADT